MYKLNVEKLLSVIHLLSILEVPHIEEAIKKIEEENSLNSRQKEKCKTLCYWAIEEKRRSRNGES